MSCRAIHRTCATAATSLMCAVTRGNRKKIRNERRQRGSHARGRESKQLKMRDGDEAVMRKGGNRKKSEMCGIETGMLEGEARKN